MTTLRGMTWNHTRGLVPLQATAQRFSELNPDVEITWEKRSLKAFEEFPIQKLAESYDLLVIDHPFVGYAAAHATLLPFDKYLPESFLKNQAECSVGASHASYAMAGHQWALAVDAAAPVAMWREDLLDEYHLRVPNTWEEVLALAKSGRVEIPAAPINGLMNFYMLCLACGEEPFLNRERVVTREIGMKALQSWRELTDLCDPACLQRNPIQSCELMARRDQKQVVYCPLAYGYSNYSRDGYAEMPLHFGDAPIFPHYGLLRSTLGGTGLAISARTKHPETCAAYAQYVATAETQRALYTQCGGQPGHRTAWLDSENNRQSRNYFAGTLPALDRAYVRPRYNGYMEFQDKGGPILAEYAHHRAEADTVLGQLDVLYRHSQSAL